MKVTEIEAVCRGRDDYAFVTPLLEKLKSLDSNASINFPLIEGGVREAEVVVSYTYIDHRPVAALLFKSERDGMVMGYVAHVGKTLVDDKPALRVIMVPHPKTDKRRARRIESSHRSYACVVTYLVNSYKTGASFRKIISV
jgi:hypothetical protein